MNRTRCAAAPPAPTRLRCAIYTRKSTEEGLEQEFNSLDAQRESGEAYIKSQAHEGWECLPAHYDDGGFSGGNMERPAMQRLLADIEMRKIDVVLVYKVDRLSRSLLDFAKMMETFDKHHVSFVSVTQQFNTASSMGRLILNVLLSFAQFEREIISERTRDKIAAARRKGKWSGGHPILGYDVNASTFKLEVNADEASRVRAIFQLYLEHEGLVATVQELQRRGWVNKRWTTRKGRERGGRPFTKSSLHQLLTNVAYIGMVKHKSETYKGEQEAIVDPSTWQRVQSLLERNGRTGGGLVRNAFGALLKGLLHCKPCDCAMTPSHSTKGNRRYRYYTCTTAQKRGWGNCPSKSVPAGELERFVVDQIRCIGRDPTVLGATLEQVRTQSHERRMDLEAEQRELTQNLARWHAEVRKEFEQPDGHAGAQGVARLAELLERIKAAETRLKTLGDEITVANLAQIDPNEAENALARFDDVWEYLSPHERCRFVQLLIKRVDFDGGRGKMSITYHDTGIQSLAGELAHWEKSA